MLQIGFLLAAFTAPVVNLWSRHRFIHTWAPFKARDIILNYVIEVKKKKEKN